MALQVKSNVWFWKGVTDFLLVINCDLCSSSHSFWVIGDFVCNLYTGSDVTLISLLGASQVKFNGGFWKAAPDLLFVLHYNFLSISHRLKVITHPNFRWDFSVWGKILAVLGSGDPKIWILVTISPKRHVYQRSHVVWCIIRHWRKSPLTCGLHGEKRWEKKVTQVWQTAIAWGRHRSTDCQFFFRRSNGLPDVVTLAKFGIDRLTRFCSTGGRNSLVSYT